MDKIALAAFFGSRRHVLAKTTKQPTAALLTSLAFLRQAAASPSIVPVGSPPSSVPMVLHPEPTSTYSFGYIFVLLCVLVAIFMLGICCGAVFFSVFGIRIVLPEFVYKRLPSLGLHPLPQTTGRSSSGTSSSTESPVTLEQADVSWPDEHPQGFKRRKASARSKTPVRSPPAKACPLPPQ